MGFGAHLLAALGDCIRFEQPIGDFGVRQRLTILVLAYERSRSPPSPAPGPGLGSFGNLRSCGLEPERVENDMHFSEV